MVLHSFSLKDCRFFNPFLYLLILSLLTYTLFCGCSIHIYVVKQSILRSPRFSPSLPPQMQLSRRSDRYLLHIANTAAYISTLSSPRPHNTFHHHYRLPHLQSRHRQHQSHHYLPLPRIHFAISLSIFALPLLPPAPCPSGSIHTALAHTTVTKIT